MKTKRQTRRSSSPQPGHRRDEPLVGALHQVAGRLVAQRRLEPDPVVVQLHVVVLVVEQPHQPGVGDRHVVALEVVVGDDLPVGRLGAVVGGVRLEPLDLVREPSARPGPATCSASGVACGSRFTKTSPASVSTRTGKSPSADLSRPGDAARLGHADQLAVEPVGPAVVEAADRLAALARARPAGASRGAGRRCGRRAARPRRRAARAPAGCPPSRSGRCPGSGSWETCAASCQVRSKMRSRSSSSDLGVAVERARGAPALVRRVRSSVATRGS